MQVFPWVRIPFCTEPPHSYTHQLLARLHSGFLVVTASRYVSSSTGSEGEALGQYGVVTEQFVVTVFPLEQGTAISWVQGPCTAHYNRQGRG
jgi:hypothetical protein